jgi:hypothetical protein
MQNLYALFGCKLLKCMLGLESLLHGLIQHEIDEPEAQVVIHKDGW